MPTQGYIIKMIHGMRIRLQGRANENAAHGTIEIAKMNDDAPLW